MMLITRIAKRAAELLIEDLSLTMTEALKLAHEEISPETVIRQEPKETETETE